MTAPEIRQAHLQAAKALRHAAHLYHTVGKSRRIAGEVATMAHLPPARETEQETTVRVKSEDRCYTVIQGNWEKDP